jgi:hypothetical protein
MAATVLTTVGKGLVTGFLTGIGSPVVPVYCAIGSGSTTATVADTTLTTEYVGGTWTGYARVSGTPTQQTTSVTHDTAQWVASWTAGASQTVAEAGNLTLATSGLLFVHGNFTGVALSSGDSIQVTITCQFT